MKKLLIYMALLSIVIGIFLPFSLAKTPENTLTSDYIAHRFVMPASNGDYDGTERPIIMFAPANIDSSKEYPLILYFHGYNYNLNAETDVNGIINMTSNQTSN